jgi:hypothetical protein
MTKKRAFWVVVAVLFSLIVFILPLYAAEKPLKLVLQITVDQLRGDLPMRFRGRLGAGGFRYLLEEGTHYNNAHYQHANTETAVGHATLATGADPSRHGIVANDWIDQKTGNFVYNTEDERTFLPQRLAMNWLFIMLAGQESSVFQSRTGVPSCLAGMRARLSGSPRAAASLLPAHTIMKIIPSG